ncbi:hypothetical protein A6E01_19950 (plasmid) [Vibrio breoganii]|uniref:Uncharacterized protein n=1 Tax=Vibrio breoganii TaxID=553239 RepID=A0AAN0XZK8_9VIBR|nr:hypothetical protein [Vibrio breoganii]ANO35488.1 hypothetical protein A6E01_19950 [Vibrio breoganii]PML13803.1 hypothetical protein BCT84_12485 [Vibrio breoganii]
MDLYTAIANKVEHKFHGNLVAEVAVDPCSRVTHEVDVSPGNLVGAIKSLLHRDMSMGVRIKRICGLDEDQIYSVI